MLISHKRAFLAGLLSRSGLLKGLELFARRPGLLVLGYHRIGEPGDGSGYPGVFSANAEVFRAQIRYFQSRFRVLTLDEIIATGPELDLKEPCVLITFDDGYRDNCEVALPILKDLNVPATFFLPTDFLDTPKLFWWDRLTLIFNNSKLDHISLERPMSIDVDLRAISRDQAIARAVAVLFDADPDAVEPWLDRLAQRAEVHVAAAELASSLLIGWDGARALLSAGMTVGSHARSHRNLARLDETSQRDELTQSKARLEAMLGTPVTALAYPYGVASAFSPRTCQIARDAGYQVAFGFGGGINRPGRSDNFALARINVGYADNLSLIRSRAVLLSTFDRSIF